MNKINTLGIWNRLELQVGCGSILICCYDAEHLTVNVPCVDEDSGEQRVDNSGKNITQKVIVTDVNKHLSYKTERIKKWKSREGLEDERKWMTDTESVFG
jgi:hypothetical protein